jgi:hypothetical protein
MFTKPESVEFILTHVDFESPELDSEAREARYLLCVNLPAEPDEAVTRG